MNEQLQQALADIVIKSTEAVGTASDFLVAEVPDVVQQALYEYAQQIREGV